MLRQFLQDSFVYGFSQIILKSIHILLIPLYTRALKPQDFGVVDLMVIFTSFVAIVIPLGISNGISRYFPDGTTDREKREFASTAIWFTLAAYGFFGIISFWFSDFLALSLFGFSLSKEVFYSGLISIILTGLFYYLQLFFRCRLQSRKFAYSNIFAAIITALSTIFFVLYCGYGAMGVFWGQIIGAFLGGLFSFLQNREIFSFTFQFSKLKQMLIFSLPMVPGCTGELVTNFIDRIAIRTLLSIKDIGIYGIGYRFASIATLLTFGFSTAITPIVMQKYRESGTPREIARIFRMFLISALLIVLFLSCFSKEIIFSFATPEYNEACNVIPILAGAFLFLTMYRFAPGLDIENKTHISAAIQVLAAVLNTLLNFSFIPFMGITGSAFATLVSGIFSFSAYFYLSQKFYPIPHNWRRISISFMVLLGMIYFDRIAFAGEIISFYRIVGKSIFFVGCCPILTQILLPKEEISRGVKFLGGFLKQFREGRKI